MTICALYINLDIYFMCGSLSSHCTVVGNIMCIHSTYFQRQKHKLKLNQSEVKLVHNIALNQEVYYQYWCQNLIIILVFTLAGQNLRPFIIKFLHDAHNFTTPNCFSEFLENVFIEISSADEKKLRSWNRKYELLPALLIQPWSLIPDLTY